MGVAQLATISYMTSPRGLSMATAGRDDSETVLADLELTRGLTIQMTAIGTLGMVVGWAVFSTLYQAATGQTSGA